MTPTRSRLSRWTFALMLFALAASLAQAGTFGKVIPITGQPSDIALDEARGKVYVANYTANRIDVVSMKTQEIVERINVAPQPASLALSPDGRYLLVAHLSNFAGTPQNGVTVMDLSGNGNMRQSFSFGSPTLGVAYGIDGMALVVTTTDFMLFDPVTGYRRTLATVSDVTTKTLPIESPNAPRSIIRASVSASGDGTMMYGMAETGGDTQALLFQYDVNAKAIRGVSWNFAPPAGPRVVTVDKTGSRYFAAWALYHAQGFQLAQFADASGAIAVGGHAFDPVRNVIYAQITKSGTATTGTAGTAGTDAGPVLQVVEQDNLAVRERLRLAENVTGRLLLDSRGDVAYGVADSGLMVLPVGALNQAPRVAASVEDIVIRGAWCNRQVMVQEFNVVNPGGGKTDFTATSTTPGISVVADSATTPSRVRVLVDTTAFQNNRGTVTGSIQIKSGAGVNIPDNVRVLINNREPDQRGSFINVPGKLVDILADPVRNRFYVLRQDKNQLLVFDASNMKQIATLKTGNTPMGMAMTADKQFLITGADNSQVAHVFNLDTLQFDRWIVFPSGHYPRSIAVSGRSILAFSRVAGPAHTIDKISMYGMATTLPSLGVWENKLDVNTVLSASPSGSLIFGASADGKTWLYDANSDTFVVSRQDFEKLSGGYAALGDDLFLVDNYMLGGSLYPAKLDSGTAVTSGYATLDNLLLRTTAATSSSPGMINKTDLSAGGAVKGVRLSEAPLLADTASTAGTFTRTLAPLANRNTIVSLSTSGITVLPWNYDVAAADPRIEAVVSAADKNASVAPGGLITIWGRDLSPINAASSQVPLPTALADSCLSVNGVLVPLIYVSPNQINGQLPVNVSGTATMILRTPGGVSNSFNFKITPAAPGVFQATVPGDGEVATVVRASNHLLATLSNPIHLDDWIEIYLTGMGLTNPAVDSGKGAPLDPLAEAIIQPKVFLGDTELSVSYAGLVPGQVGLYQINAKVPFKNVQTGMEVPLSVRQGDQSSTVVVRVVH